MRELEECLPIPAKQEKKEEEIEAVKNVASGGVWMIQHPRKSTGKKDTTVFGVS